METYDCFTATSYPNKTTRHLRITYAARLLALLLVALPTVVQAQFTFITNNGAITITGYSGSGGDATIPDIINGLPVTSIGDWAFNKVVHLTNVIIGTNVTSIGEGAFYYCYELTNVTIPNSVANIGDGPFAGCAHLTAIAVDTNNPSYTSVDGVLFDKSQTMLVQYPAAKAGNSYTIPDSVTSIGYEAFFRCKMTNVTIGASVTSIGYQAFFICYNLMGVYFKGNAPSLGPSVFVGDNNATIYYLPGTTGWPTPPETFGGLTTAFCFLPNPLILNNSPSFGVKTNCFGFIIAWATNIPVVVEACTNLANPVWEPLQSCTITNGSAYFSDPDWTNHPTRLYRIRSP